MTRPALPGDPVTVHLRFVAAQPPGAPCWRVEFDPPGPTPDRGLVVHRVTFADVGARTAEAGQRGHVEAHGVAVWDYQAPGDGLWLVIQPAD